MSIMEKKTYIDKEAAFEKSASWEDVRAKAQAIVDNGGVEIYEDSPTQVGAYVMSGVVAGMYPVTDGGPYDVILSKRSWENKGNVGGWVQAFLCDCMWGQYHSGRPGAGYSGRFCSHAMATLLVSNARASKGFMGDRTASSEWRREEIDGEMCHVRDYGNVVGIIEKYKYWRIEDKDGHWLDYGREPNLAESKASCDFYAETENRMYASIEAGYDKDNFYECTKAVWVPVNAPEAEPDFVSDSGSMYWHYPEGVVRGADHWGNDIGDCDWHMLGDEQLSSWFDKHDDVRYGFCPWQGFEPNTGGDMAKTAGDMPELYAVEYFSGKTVGYAYNDGSWRIERDGVCVDSGQYDGYLALGDNAVSEMEGFAKMNGVKMHKPRLEYASRSKNAKLYTALVRLDLSHTYVIKRDGYSSKKEFEQDLRGNGYRVLHVWEGDVSESEVDDWLLVNRFPERRESARSQADVSRRANEYADATGDDLSDFLYDIILNSAIDKAIRRAKEVAMSMSSNSIADSSLIFDAGYDGFCEEVENSEFIQNPDAFVGLHIDELDSAISEVCEQYGFNPDSSLSEYDRLVYGKRNRSCGNIGRSKDAKLYTHSLASRCASIIDDIEDTANAVENGAGVDFIEDEAERIFPGDIESQANFIDAVHEELRSRGASRIAGSFEKDQFGDWTKDYGDGTYGVIYEYDGEYAVDFSCPLPLRTFYVADFTTAQALCDDLHTKVIDNPDYASDYLQLYTNLTSRKRANVDFNAISKMVEFGIDLYHNQFKNWQSLVDIQNDEDVQYYKDGLDMIDEDWQEGCRRIWEEISMVASRVASHSLYFTEQGGGQVAEFDGEIIPETWGEMSTNMFGNSYDFEDGEAEDIGIVDEYTGEVDPWALLDFIRELEEMVEMKDSVGWGDYASRAAREAKEVEAAEHRIYDEWEDLGSGCHGKTVWDIWTPQGSNSVVQTPLFTVNVQPFDGSTWEVLVDGSGQFAGWSAYEYNFVSPQDAMAWADGEIQEELAMDGELGIYVASSRLGGSRCRRVRVKRAELYQLEDLFDSSRNLQGETYADADGMWHWRINDLDEGYVAIDESDVPVGPYDSEDDAVDDMLGFGDVRLASRKTAEWRRFDQLFGISFENEYDDEYSGYLDIWDMGDGGATWQLEHWRGDGTSDTVESGRLPADSPEMLEATGKSLVDDAYARHSGKAASRKVAFDLPDSFRKGPWRTVDDSGVVYYEEDGISVEFEQNYDGTWWVGGSAGIGKPLPEQDGFPTEYDALAWARENRIWEKYASRKMAFREVYEDLVYAGDDFVALDTWVEHDDEYDVWLVEIESADSSGFSGVGSGDSLFQAANEALEAAGLVMSSDEREDYIGNLKFNVEDDMRLRYANRKTAEMEWVWPSATHGFGYGLNSETCAEVQVMNNGMVWWGVYENEDERYGGECIQEGAEDSVDAAIEQVEHLFGRWASHKAQQLDLFNEEYVLGFNVNLSDMRWDAGAEWYETELDDESGHKLVFMVVDMGNDGPWGWELDDSSQRIAENFEDKFATAQEALDDFNDWCNFNVNGGRVANTVTNDGNFAIGDVYRYWENGPLFEVSEIDGNDVFIELVDGSDPDFPLWAESGELRSELEANGMWVEASYRVAQQVSIPPFTQWGGAYGYGELVDICSNGEWEDDMTFEASYMLDYMGEEISCAVQDDYRKSGIYEFTIAGQNAAVEAFWTDSYPSFSGDVNELAGIAQFIDRNFAAHQNDLQRVIDSIYSPAIWNDKVVQFGNSHNLVVNNVTDKRVELYLDNGMDRNDPHIICVLCGDGSDYYSVLWYDGARGVNWYDPSHGQDAEMTDANMKFDDFDDIESAYNFLKQKTASRKVANTTSSGLYYEVAFDIDPSWSGYDKSVAEGQMFTYGKVFVDEYGSPIDDEYMADEAADDYDMLMREGSRKVAVNIDSLAFSDVDEREGICELGNGCYLYFDSFYHHDTDCDEYEWVLNVPDGSYEETIDRGGYFQSMQEAFEDFKSKYRGCSSSDWVDVGGSMSWPNAESYGFEAVYNPDYDVEYINKAVKNDNGRWPVILGYDGVWCGAESQPVDWSENGNLLFGITNQSNLWGLPTPEDALNAILKAGGFPLSASRKTAYGYGSYDEGSVWVCYEDGLEGEYTLPMMKSYYEENVDKGEYPEFPDWEWDATRSGFFNRVAQKIAVEQIVEWNSQMEFYEGMYGDDVAMLGGYTPSGREVAIEWDPGFEPETVTISIDGMPVADVFNNSKMELTDEALQKAMDTANVEAFIMEHDLHPQRDYWGNPLLGKRTANEDIQVGDLVDLLYDDFSAGELDVYAGTYEVLDMQGMSWRDSDGGYASDCKFKLKNIETGEVRQVTPGYGKTVVKSAAAGAEWEVYQVVDGFPTSDIEGYMYRHGYDGWYLIRHDDEWGDRKFGPYSSLDELMRAHDLHDGDVKVLARRESRVAAWKQPFATSGDFDRYENDYMWEDYPFVGYVDRIWIGENIDHYEWELLDEVGNAVESGWANTLEDAQLFCDDAALLATKSKASARRKTAFNDDEGHGYQWFVDDSGFACVRIYPFGQAFVSDLTDADWGGPYGVQVYNAYGDKGFEMSRAIDVDAAKALADEYARDNGLFGDGSFGVSATKSKASKKTATRQFTYAEMKELEDEIEDTELKNADRFKDGGAAYYAAL